MLPSFTGATVLEADPEIGAHLDKANSGWPLNASISTASIGVVVAPDDRGFCFLAPPSEAAGRRAWDGMMKIKNSLKSLKSRHRDCRVVRRRGRVYVINKTQRRFKARQG